MKEKLGKYLQNSPNYSHLKKTMCKKTEHFRKVKKSMKNPDFRFKITIKSPKMLQLSQESPKLCIVVLILSI